jgi:predicted porin
VEWANIKYQFTPDFSVRAGRIVLPAFLVSDYRKVGYANTWLRPPVEVYSMIPVTNSDGVDASYRLRVGDVTNTVQVIYGNTEPRLPTGGSVSAKDVWGISGTGEYGAAIVHASYIKGTFTLESTKPLFDGFRQFGPEGAALAAKYDADHKSLTFLSIGGTYDPGRWFVQGEWGSTDTHSAFGKRSAWYASGGYRLGKITPYLIYARTKSDSNTSDAGLTLSSLPPFLAGAAAGLNAGLNGLLGAVPVQKTVSAGARWDFMKNVDLKLQVDHTRLGAGSTGTLINTQPDFRPGGTFNVVSAVVDFVFRWYGPCLRCDAACSVPSC